MMDLVFHKVEEIAQMHSCLLEEGIGQEDWSSLFTVTDCSDKAACIGDAVSHVLHCAADFYRRFQLTVRSYPTLLLWLVRRQPDVECDDRCNLARDLLQCNALELDQTTRKFRMLFEKDLAIIAEHKTCPYGLQ